MIRPGSGRPMPPETAVRVVHVLAAHPELRELFPVADEIDTWVRWSC
jgi:hypothetical protein